jgi:hypothetical protein
MSSLLANVQSFTVLVVEQDTILPNSFWEAISRIQLQHSKFSISQVVSD